MNLSNKHFLAATIWCALLGITYWVMDRETSPKIAKVTMEREVNVPRSRDGHFYIAGTINGQPVDFLVDTGATTTAVSVELAKKLGLTRGAPITVHTANGMTQGEVSTDNTITLNGIAVSRVNVIVLNNMDGFALLGQNVLSHLQMTQTSEGMSLRANSP